ncbi:MAG: indole-3-glycerol phosphate synthase TrpC [Syntrophomonadaceae bacterium]|jgi:indole-3-glycerol phosphate synthase|nr:indole-3-glycerol phosphate synthase TrpC [Syntrophomonadaceae bacterium]
MTLERILAHKKKEVAQRKQLFPLPELKKQLPRQRHEPAGFQIALAQDGASLIAEIKKASPTKGVLRPDFDPVKIARCYEENGASAISVLTDAEFFLGSLDCLKQVREATRLPILCKDFIIDPYQIYEASLYGADAVLLIAGVLDQEDLASFYRLATDLALAALVEVHSPSELGLALQAGAEIIGINNRDLKTFRTDLKTTLEMAAMVPDHCLLVSESGISTADDIRRLAAAGVDAVLVGEALVTSKDIGQKVRELAGR